MGKLTEALEAVQFAAAVCRGLPNPIAAGALAGGIIVLVETAAEVAEEAEQQASSTASTPSSTATSTTSSQTSGPTPHLVVLDSKWPGFLVDAFVEAFPDQGEGMREDYAHLGLRTYVTNISDSLADAISILPIFKFIVGNEDPGMFDNADVAGAVPEPRRGKSPSSPPGHLQQRSAPLSPRAVTFNQQFPLMLAHSPPQRYLPAKHLPLLSYSPNAARLVSTYTYESSKNE